MNAKFHTLITKGAQWEYYENYIAFHKTTITHYARHKPILVINNQSLTDVQQAIIDHLISSGRLPAGVQVLSENTKSIFNEIEQAVANHGLCISVHPPLPIRAMQGVPFIFFENCEIRIRITEKPSVNQTGANIYEIAEEVAIALHWQPKTAGSPLDGILACPLQIASRPMELVNQNEPSIRTIDVIFEATFQINPTIE